MNTEKLNRICVLDSHCGSGKTSWAIQYINSLPEDVSVIFITPFLVECERVKKSCPDKNFFAPDVQHGKGSKTTDFENLLSKGVNIVSTHALFSGISDDMIELIRSNNYLLILDEVMDVVSRINIYDEARLKDDDKERLMSEDITTLIETGIIQIQDDYSVKWVSDDNILNKYAKIKNLADRNLLYIIDNELFIWTFPVEVFKEGIFKQIFVLTYMFDYQIQAYYYNYYGLEYSKYYVCNVGDKQYKIFPEDGNLEYDKQWRKSIVDLIDICDHQKLNKIGDYYEDALKRIRKTALSQSWFGKTSENVVKRLNLNISNYFYNLTKSKAKQRMWTCFKAHKKYFKGNKELANKNWISLNARATNDFADRDVLVYPINRYLNPFYDKFFKKKDIVVDEDAFALSEMIQWVFRSAIRNGQKISLYCPSRRMRELFIGWLNGE